MTEPMPSEDVPGHLRKVAREAFAGRPPMADGVFALPSDRNPWRALDDALAAVLPAHEVMVRAALARHLTDLAGGMRDVGAQIDIDGDPAEAASYEDGAQHLDDIARMIRGEGLNAIPRIRWSRS